MGETVSGIIEIQGGAVEQQIDEIYLTLHTNYKAERDDHTYEKTATINHYLIHQSFTISQMKREKYHLVFNCHLRHHLQLVIKGLD